MTTFVSRPKHLELGAKQKWEAERDPEAKRIQTITVHPAQRAEDTVQGHGTRGRERGRRGCGKTETENLRNSPKTLILDAKRRREVERDPEANRI